MHAWLRLPTCMLPCMHAAADDACTLPLSCSTFVPRLLCCLRLSCCICHTFLISSAGCEDFFDIRCQTHNRGASTIDYNSLSRAHC